jgi:hypothetical protein
VDSESNVKEKRTVYQKFLKSVLNALGEESTKSDELHSAAYMIFEILTNKDKEEQKKRQEIKS